VDSAYDDNVPWIKKLVHFIRNLIENYPKVKLVGEFSLRSLGPLANRRTGICFGHQIICRALGGDSIRTPHFEIGPTLVNLSDMGRSIFGVDQLVSQRFSFLDPELMIFPSVSFTDCAGNPY